MYGHQHPDTTERRSKVVRVVPGTTTTTTRSRTPDRIQTPRRRYDTGGVNRNHKHHFHQQHHHQQQQQQQQQPLSATRSSLLSNASCSSSTNDNGSYNNTITNTNRRRHSSGTTGTTTIGGGGIMKPSSFVTQSSAVRIVPCISSSSSCSVPSVAVLSLASSSSDDDEEQVSTTSWQSRCHGTGEYCAAGHEFLRIPTSDRQHYLRRKQQQQQQQNTKVMSQTPIIIECDCCSKIIPANDFIAGCCFHCDIDLCADCYQKGQSYLDVILKQSRDADCQDAVETECQIQKQQLYHQRRYNGTRPTYLGTGRINYDDYPDPTVYQWSFTGCNTGAEDVVLDDGSRVVYPIEYFEKDFGKTIGIIQLDFYYTIGTLSTYLIHPRHGTRDLFTAPHTQSSQGRLPKRLSQESYRKILKDPRTYTNTRYKKQTKNNSNSTILEQQPQHQVL